MNHSGPRGQSDGTYSQNSAQPERSRQGAEAAPSQEQRGADPWLAPSVMNPARQRPEDKALSDICSESGRTFV